MRVDIIITALNNLRNNKDEIVEAGPLGVPKYIEQVIKAGLLPHLAATWVTKNKALREATIEKLKEVPQVTRVRISKIKKGGVNYLQHDIKKCIDRKE